MNQDKARECAAKIHRWLTEYNTATDTEQCKQAMNLLTEAEKYLEHFPPSVPVSKLEELMRKHQLGDFVAWNPALRALIAEAK